MRVVSLRGYGVLVNECFTSRRMGIWDALPQSALFDTCAHSLCLSTWLKQG
jgi:hypothetical protein